MISHFQKSVSFLLAVILLALPFYLLSTPRQAEAQGACLAAAAGWVLGLFGLQMGLTQTGNALSPPNHTLAVPVSNLPQDNYSNANSVGQQVQGAISGIVSWKECILDPLAWLAKTIIIEAITTAIVDWINSGFEGSPVFMTNLSGFLMDVADKVAGEFIFESGLGFLCSPFQLNIRVQLMIAWYSKWGSEGSYCKLSDIVTNIDDFLAGNFMDGGWAGFAQMNNYPSGNPQGSFLDAASQLSLQINSKTFEEDALLARAFNFLSPRNPDGSGSIVTPGKYVENELNSWTDSPLGQLTVADEVDEIIGALFTYLVQNILTGDTGLRGVSDGYTDQIRNGQTLACIARQQDLIDRINALIASEQAGGHTEFIAQLQALIARAQAVQCDPLDLNYPTLFAAIDADLVAIQSQINIRNTGYACSDTIDNDGDGLTDYPADPGCTSAAGTSEAGDGIPPPPPPPAQCSDGLDNDGDGLIDYPADPECTSAAGTSEVGGNGNPVPPPPTPPIAACSDNLDNDGDGLIDYPADPGCTSAAGTSEVDGGGGPPPPLGGPPAP